jgi:hypothetical protein
MRVEDSNRDFVVITQPEPWLIKEAKSMLSRNGNLNVRCGPFKLLTPDMFYIHFYNDPRNGMKFYLHLPIKKKP